MKRLALALVLTFIVGVVAGGIGGPVLSAQQMPVKRTVIQKVDLVDRDGIMYLAEIAPGAAAGKHYHPGPEVVYTLQGSWILEVEGKPPLTLKAGESSQIPAKQVHNATNASKTDPVKILVFLAAEKGQPLATNVK